MGCLAAVATGCGTDYEGTRKRAVEEARRVAGYTVDHMEDLFSADDVPTGRRLVTAVRGAVADSPDGTVVYELEQVDDDTVRLKAAFDGYDQSGGGGTYYSFRARVCIQFLLTSGNDQDVDVSDTECRQEDLDAVGAVEGANEVVSYED